MSRTDDVRGKGRERGGTGGGAPFVRWGERYAWIEGRVAGSFNTKYGLAITLDVLGVGGAVLEAQGRDEDGNDFTTRVEAGIKVNVGTQSATLAGKITADDEGGIFHVAFEGWESPKGGNRYRVFTVIELSDREPAPESREDTHAEADVGATTGHAGPGHPDADLPF